MKNILIVYYSRKGENYWNGSLKHIEKGNTERVAEFIQKAVGGDLFEINTVKPYSESYMTCIEEAKQELREKARPEIKAYPDNFDDYDTIFVGYPNWWGTTIIPFCTNEGSGMGASERDLKKLCKGATIKAGLSVHGAEAETSESKVSAWAKKSV